MDKGTGKKKGTEQMVNPVMCILPQFKKTVKCKN